MSEHDMTLTEPVQEVQEQGPAKSGRLSPFAIVVLVLAVALIAMLGLQLVNTNITQPTSGPAPQFALTLFDELGGGGFNLAENQGKVIVVNFWASWCGPCRIEAPDLQALWEEYSTGDEVVFVGVNWVDNTQDALGYLNEFGITYPNGPDLGSRIGDAYRIQGVPETFVIDPNGNVHQFFLAPVSASTLRASIQGAQAAASEG